MCWPDHDLCSLTGIEYQVSRQYAQPPDTTTAGRTAIVHRTVNLNYKTSDIRSLFVCITNTRNVFCDCMVYNNSKERESTTPPNKQTNKQTNKQNNNSKNNKQIKNKKQPQIPYNRSFERMLKLSETYFAITWYATIQKTRQPPPPPPTTTTTHTTTTTKTKMGVGGLYLTLYTVTTRKSYINPVTAMVSFENDS